MSSDLPNAPLVDTASLDGEVLIKEFERQLAVHSEFVDEEEVYRLYSEYARCRGFSVRRGKQTYYDGTKILNKKDYKCSCAGLYNHKLSDDKLMGYKKQHHRTNCLARLRISRAKGCLWSVIMFVKEHNHELVSPDLGFIHRSMRKLDKSKLCILEEMQNSGIGISSAYRFMEKQAGGQENVGFTKKDAYNHMDKAKLFSRVPNGDASALMSFFIDNSNREQYFYWKADMDEEGRLMNFFFRDSRSLADYEMFGDIISVDTTYRTNKYDLVVAPFVGINHHRNNILLGVGFLSNETTESFLWLFDTFLDSMYGIHPQVIFTDQCQAMMNAIDTTFTQSSHRLCQWHINQNAPSHLGSLNCNQEFKYLWHKCMVVVESEEEFESCWAEMISTNALEGHRWLANMYSLRRRWAPVFTQERFSAGLLATSRSEATNKVVKDICASTNSLFEFVQCFESVKKNWRNTELQEDASNIGVPGQYVNHNYMLIKAAKQLTRAAFKVFESEAAHTFNCVSRALTTEPNADVLVFGVASQPDLGRESVVRFDIHTSKATCTCHMFESEGIICKHIIKVFGELQVLDLPEWCICRRWSKDAKRRKFEEIYERSAEPGSASLTGLAFLNRMMRFTFDVANDSKDNDECRALCLKSMAALKTVVDDKVHGLRPKLPSYMQSPSSTRVPFSDPKPSKRRTKNAADLPPTGHWSAKKPKKPRTTNKRTNSAPTGDVARSPLSTPCKESGGRRGNGGLDAKDDTGEAHLSSQKSVNIESGNVVDIAEIFQVVWFSIRKFYTIPFGRVWFDESRLREPLQFSSRLN